MTAHHWRHHAPHPHHTQTGLYTVSLRVTDGAFTHVQTKTHYISVGDARVIEYEYDDLYRLVEADYRSTGLTTGTSGEYFAYAYDAEAAQAIRGGTNDTTDRETINAICRDLL